MYLQYALRAISSINEADDRDDKTDRGNDEADRRHREADDRAFPHGTDRDDKTDDAAYSHVYAEGDRSDLHAKGLYAYDLSLRILREDQLHGGAGS